ncbi:unnamed protein product [Adineta steineri]|uniref:Uncharacterized protein n=1 Tax=Adineta steineri TaxID=433720 RepID=A0A814VF44_9BILA|nr:unnamed protein product [Adineta steineri]CAF1184572.1 unnamed protein product [Adineta steineri]
MTMNCSQLIVWLDANANDYTSSFRKKLTDNEHQCVKIFTEVNPCITFIETHINQTIFFILSGSFGSEVIPLIYHYDHISQIYLFCASIVSHTSWAIDYADKMLMFDHENDLLRRLFKDIEEYLRLQAEQYLKQANHCKAYAELFKQDQCG